MMMSRKRVISSYFAVCLLALFLSGCAGTVKNMRAVPPDRVVAAPEEGKSMVVFMRPSTLGFAIQSSVFEIKEDKPLLVGIVAAKAKVSYQLEPGEHLFMVVGESADYMSAELEVNKTYYALVTPRMGAWKARFSLKPIHVDETSGSQLDEWKEDCEWVEKSPASDDWASTNMASILSKHNKYYKKWMSKDLSDRPRLLPQDGK
jgi:hypothetical protein